MPKVNENEKRLLTVLGIVVFLAANVFGYLLINAMMKSLDTQKVQLNKQLASLEDARANAAEADVKANWMAQHFKGYPTAEFRETYLEGLVNSDLTAGLEVDISKRSQLPTETSDFCVRSRFRVNVKGPWTDVYKFIYRLQKPEEFRFVPQLTLVPKKAESDDSVQVVEVQVTIEKWWPKPDGTVNADENLLAKDEQNGDGAVNTDGATGNGSPGSSNEGPAPTPTPAPSPAPSPAPAPADSSKPATPPASESPAPTPPADTTTSPKPNP